MGISVFLLTIVLPFQIGGESQTLLELEAVQLAPELGRALAPYSDHNGDGVSDYLVGAKRSAFIVSGSDGKILLTIEQTATPSFGKEISRAGDLNGDGIEEVLIGAPNASPAGLQEAGSTFLYSGLNGQLLLEWHGTSAYGHHGSALSPMIDFDSDGTPDLAVGAPEAGAQDRGKVFLYSGATGQTIHTLEGTPFDSFGAALALADDLDFDGIPDLVIGAPNQEDPGISWGAIFFYSGIDGHLIRKIPGPSTTTPFGSRFAMTEDMDGDGVQEIAVAIPDGNWAGWAGQGLVHVHSGATGAMLHNLGGFYDGHRFGSDVASVGDIDQDGKGDFVVLSSNSLDSYLYSGTGTLLDTISAGTVMSQISGTKDLNADGFPDWVVASSGSSQVVTISGSTRNELYRIQRSSSYSFGSCIIQVGDINGDGQVDVAVGDPEGGTQSGQGAVTVYAGADGRVLLQLEGPHSSAALGTSLLAAGDINNDGHDDFLAGAPGESSGQASQVLAYSGIDGSILYSCIGVTGSRFGQSIARLSDLNGDSIAEFLVGAPNADTVMVYSGADGAFLWQVNGPQAGESFGSSVASVDVDQDGTRDLVIGAPFATPWQPNWQSGTVYVHSGMTGFLLFAKHGPNNDDAHLGRSVAAAGDVDGDGIGDILGGAPEENTGGFTSQGTVRVWSGASSQLLHRFEGSDHDMYIGNAVSSADDIDRDGYADLLLGSDAQGFLLYSGATGALLHRNSGGSLEHRLGRAVASLGDIDGNGSPDIGVGAPHQAGHGITGSAFVYDFSPFLSTDSYDLNLTSGGHLNLSLDFSAVQAQRDYKVLVSTTGTGPTVFGVSIPLTPDAVARASFQGNYPFPSHSGLQGSLDLQGDALATIDLPAGLPSQLLGLRFWLAAIALSPGQVPEASSVALPFRIGP